MRRASKRCIFFAVLPLFAVPAGGVAAKRTPADMAEFYLQFPANGFSFAVTHMGKTGVRVHFLKNRPIGHWVLPGSRRRTSGDCSNAQESGAGGGIGTLTPVFENGGNRGQKERTGSGWSRAGTGSRNGVRFTSRVRDAGSEGSSLNWRDSS